ncbi:MAG: helix-turn-helix transcriptional regulator [Methyloceanibacter sp.]
MAGSDDALELIPRIYDAAFDAALWPEVLTQIAGALGAGLIIMGFYETVEHSVAFNPRQNGCDQGASCRGYWAPHNILWQRNHSEPVGRVLAAEPLMPGDTSTGIDVCHNWIRPQGMEIPGDPVNLVVERKASAVCGFGPSTVGGRFSARHTAIFRALAPHLLRAVKVQRRLWQLRLSEQLALTGLNLQNEGIILVDGTGRVVFVNGAVATLLGRRDQPRLDAGLLRAADPADANALSNLITVCADAELGDGERGGTIDVARGTGRPPLRMLVVPFQAGRRQFDVPWLGLPQPAAVVIVRDPERERRLRKEHLTRRFRLTPAEADLALEIAKGDGREAAAGRLGISVGTARVHLTRVFDKTGVHRQTELVRLLLQSQAEISKL